MIRNVLTLAVLVVVTGFVLQAAPRIPFLSWVGRLPGDFRIRSGRTEYRLPIASSIVIAVLLTLLIRLLPFVAR